jgi:threonine/homoserine/homoserine lactone efflux protein
MDPSAALIGILATLSFGAKSPGPRFVFVARTTVARGRRDGLAAALGMGIGGLFFAILAFVGLTAVIAQLGSVYLGFKVLGGVYLLYLAYRLWRASAEQRDDLSSPGVASAGAQPKRSFLLGMGTQLSNPKTAVFYASVFATFLPPTYPGWLPIVGMPAIFAIEAGWYSIVAVGLSSARPRSTYLRWKRWIDRLSGTVLGALGIKLIAEAGRTA